MEWGRWEAACVPLWAFMVFTLWTNAQGQSGRYLSVGDILLLKDEPSPTCFSLMVDGIAKEFTCFLLTEDSDSAFDFYYTIDNPPRRTLCELQVQRAEHGGFLHFCSFPPADIFLFDEIPLDVLDRNKNSSLYSRTVTVEDNILPEPPSNISITQSDNIGELLLSWQAQCSFTLFYKIRYASKSKNQTIKKGHNKLKETLDDLVPGEVVEVQVSVRCSPSRTTGHWSQWSPTVKAVVPQSADDISLKCSTKDLLNISCHWDNSTFSTEAGYTLFYKMDSEGQGWTSWRECHPETNETDQCGFEGSANKRIKVKLSSPEAPLSNIFYSEGFKLNSIIKTGPPSVLKQNETDTSCVSWDCPLPALSSHLQYELNYRPTTDNHWLTISSNGPDTAVCLKLSWSSQFEVKVRAKPSGTVYSGQWSDWSDVLTAEIPVHSSPLILLAHFSPVFLLVFAVLFISLFFKYFKKLKQYVWPPVPNLDKVLQDFLTDFNQHKWDAPVSTKQFHGDTTASIIEVLSCDEDSALEEASAKSTALSSSMDTSCSSVGQEDNSTDTELYPGYVELNKNNIILCTKGNSYICEDLQNEDKKIKAKQASPKSSDDSSPSGHCSGSDFLNQSYLAMETDKEREQKGQGNVYTNMPCN